ncbi:hypothetical protein, partial [Pseudomonas huaxiensis]|uniref:hypothetical protein n=1 Tax=Pseudomonas huaxiensis TaxID=2213017 RepID=UPI001CDC39FC
MALLSRNWIFLFFSFSLVALGVASHGVSENPLDPLETRGLPPVVIYFVALWVPSVVSLVFAAVGRLTWRKLSAPGVMRVLARVLCFMPMLLTFCAIAIVSAGFV